VQACLWLSSDRAGFITGESLTIDGGIMAMGGWAGAA
jgi:NAD(P)-dependent dehydrogenase (short-subunit alcohol dehydrogenase family)